MSTEAMKLEKIMEQAQVFASAWSLVGGRFDNGNMLDEAEVAKNELRQMVAKALAEQPKFTKHTVEQTSDWSEWVCPDPKGYLMKCCDCGLVHETQFGVAKYKPNSTEDCDMVDDPNLQAIFRMRRSEEQPAQQEPVAEAMARYLRVCSSGGMPKKLLESVQGLVEHAQRLGYFKAAPQPAPVQQEPVAWIVEDQRGERLEWASDAHSCHGVPTFPLYTKEHA